MAELVMRAIDAYLQLRPTDDRVEMVLRHAGYGDPSHPDYRAPGS